MNERKAAGCGSEGGGEKALGSPSPLTDEWPWSSPRTGSQHAKKGLPGTTVFRPSPASRNAPIPFLFENRLVSAPHVPAFFLSVLFTKVSLCFQLIRKAPLIHN